MGFFLNGSKNLNDFQYNIGKQIWRQQIASFETNNIKAIQHHTSDLI